MKAKLYAKTKPSGVEWLGHVPEHWEVKRSRWIGNAIIGLTYSPTDVVAEGDGALVLRSSNIQNGKIVLTDNVFVSAEIPHRLRTKIGDILICTRNGSRDLVGKTGKISNSESGLTFGAFTAVYRSSANDYMFYVFNSGLFSFQAGLFQTSTIFQLTNSTINAFQIPLPPPVEQRAIVAYLDRETQRIDLLVAKKRELIERLKEKRSALISRTVTSGLPPAAAKAAGLPVNPKMKDSGIEWLGEIPGHWEVIRLGRRIELQRGVDITKDEQREGDVPVVSSGGIASYHDTVFARGPGVVVGRKGTAGAVYYVETDYWPHDTTLYVKEFRGNIPRYVFYKLCSMDLASFDTGTANPTINRNVVHPVFVSWPPLPEQTAIAAYLDAETTKLDALVAKVEEAVERLQEYRSALITAAVTGKIDVRNEV